MISYDGYSFMHQLLHSLYIGIMSSLYSSCIAGVARETQSLLKTLRPAAGAGFLTPCTGPRLLNMDKALEPASILSQ